MRDYDENIAVLKSLGVIGDEEAEKAPKSQKRENDDLSVEELVGRLRSIKKRLDRLQIVFASSLSREISNEIDIWRERFKELADNLIDRDAEALYEIVRGSEYLIVSPSKPQPKPVIPLATQRMAELIWQVRQMPEPKRPKGDGFNDGLGAFVS